MTKLDTEQRQDDLSKATDSFTKGKAPQNMLCNQKLTNTEILDYQQHLHGVLRLCWKDGTVYRGM